MAVYHGSARKQLSDKFSDYDIVLTTYETVRMDWTTTQFLYGQEWHRLVLDEGLYFRAFPEALR